MREMKDSGIEWIGEIPKEWNIIPTKYCFTVNNGSDPTTNDGDTPVYGSGSKSFKTCIEFKEGPTVLLGRKGTVNIPQWIDGRYWNVDTAFDVKPKGNYSLKFFYYTAICFDYENYSTQTALPSMTQGNYLNIKLPYMSLSDQYRIVNFLDAKCAEIDALTADIQTQIDILEQYKRSVITEAVTKGLNPDVEMKDSGLKWIGKIPSPWNVMPNKYLMKKKKVICPVYNGEDILSLTMKGVIVRDLDAGGKMPTSFDGYQRLEPGNLLMCLFDIDVTPRCIGLIKQAGLSSPAYSQFELNGMVNAEYYCYYYTMLDNDKTLLHLAKNLRHSLTEDQLGAISVIVPPVQEQKIIADFLDAKCEEIDKVIAAKIEQLAIVDEYKKSLIYEYVTGKKEVPYI